MIALNTKITRWSAHPERSLMIAIIEQAVRDLKALQAKGVVEAGRILPEYQTWPMTCVNKGRPIADRVLGYYHDGASVNNLLHFFKTDLLQRVLDLAESDFEANIIREHFKLKDS